jgi:hypothetical protein
MIRQFRSERYDRGRRLPEVPPFGSFIGGLACSFQMSFVLEPERVAADDRPRSRCVRELL